MHATIVRPVVLTAREAAIYFNGSDSECEGLMRVLHQTAAHKARRANHKVDILLNSGEVVETIYPHTEV